MLGFPRATMLAAAVMAAAVGVSAPAAEGASRVANVAAHDSAVHDSAVHDSAVDDAADSGHLGIRLVDVPADLVGDPRAHEYIIDSLAPGVTVHRRIELANTTNAAVRVQLYPDAATITRGAFVGAPGATISDLTTWTTLSQPAIELPAHTTALDTVSVAVPKDASAGERYGVVWAQTSAGHGPGITLVNRVGIRIYLWVGGNNPPASDFSIATMTASRAPDGRAVVQAQVHNTGGRALDMTGTLTLSAAKGSLTAGPYAVQLGTTMAPGQTEPVRATVTDPVGDGPWNATFHLHSGILDRTYQAQVTFPRQIGVAMAATVHQQTTEADYALLYAVLSGVIALAALLAFRAARRRSTRGNPGSGDHTP